MISSLEPAGRTRAHPALDQLRRLVCAVATGLICAAPATAAEYLVRPGDVLSLKFIGGSDSSYSIPVEIDGLAWFPIIGGLPVSGLNMAEVRRQVADAYAVTSVSFGAGGSAELLRPNQVHVGVAQYRPVYVGGSLGQPVVIDYRPGLTLRQALTLAASRQASPETASDVTERIEALTYEKGRIEARIWRLRAVLGEASPDEFQKVFGSRSPDVRQIASLERSVVEALEGERQREHRALQDEIRRTEGRIAVLLAQREIELEVQQIDDKLAENMRLAPTSEVADARRAALTSATRVLQLDVQIESARSRLSELKVLEGEVMVDGAGERWSALADQLALYHKTEAELLALRSSALVPDDEPPTQVVITRDTGETIHTTVGDATQALLPGDVIDLVTESPVAPLCC